MIKKLLFLVISILVLIMFFIIFKGHFSNALGIKNSFFDAEDDAKIYQTIDKDCYFEKDICINVEIIVGDEDE